MGQEFDNSLNSLAMQALYSKACNETKTQIPPEVFKEALETEATSSQCQAARDNYTAMALFGGISGNPLLITTGLVGAAKAEQANKLLSSIGK